MGISTFGSLLAIEFVLGDYNKKSDEIEVPIIYILAATLAWPLFHCYNCFTFTKHLLFDPDEEE